MFSSSQRSEDLQVVIKFWWTANLLWKADLYPPLGKQNPYMFLVMPDWWSIFGFDLSPLCRRILCHKKYLMLPTLTYVVWKIFAAGYFKRQEETARTGGGSLCYCTIEILKSLITICLKAKGFVNFYLKAHSQFIDHINLFKPISKSKYSSKGLFGSAFYSKKWLLTCHLIR